MTALKQAIEEVSGFFLPAGRNHKKGEGMRKEQFASLACGISHCWQSIDWNVTGRELFIIEAIQESLFLHKLENKQVIYFLLPDDSFEKLMGFAKAFRWDFTGHVSVALSGCSQGQPLMRGPAQFSMESSWLPRPLYTSPHLGASKRVPCHHPLQASLGKTLQVSVPCQGSTRTWPCLLVWGAPCLTLSIICRLFVAKSGGSCRTPAFVCCA